ncbi:MFS transporter [Faecalispora jeddahensis]|uniref:MFS transporter n=1 Tax=Faecalispora jeddahensis TaxID=1414721 RepID=UPI0028A8764B|nr:MFS transporter [Faecalispora jeddahensis]
MKRISSGMRMILMIGCCGALAIFSSTISKSPILPLFAKSLGADGTQIGWIASASTVPGILVSYIAGDLADRFGYRKILIGSLLIFSSAPFLYLIVQNPQELGAVRFYHGFATAAFGPVAMAVIAAFSGKNNMGQNLSLYSSATLVGRALAPAAGGTLYQFGGYASVYLAAGIAALLALAAAVWFFRKPGEADQSAVQAKGDDAEKIPFFKKLWGVLSYRPLFLVGVLDACAYFAYGAFEMIFPLYAKQLGMSTAEIGLLLGIQLVGMILFKPLFGRASDRFGRLPMAVSGFLACTLAFFLLAVLKSTAAIIPLILVYGLGFALITASTSALVADVARAGQLGASLGILSTLMDVGQTFGPPAIGAISDRYNYAVGIGTLGILLLLAAAGCAIALIKQHRRGPL